MLLNKLSDLHGFQDISVQSIYFKIGWYEKGDMAIGSSVIFNNGKAAGAQRLAHILYTETFGMVITKFPQHAFLDTTCRKPKVSSK